MAGARCTCAWPVLLQDALATPWLRKPRMLHEDTTLRLKIEGTFSMQLAWLEELVNLIQRRLHAKESSFTASKRIHWKTLIIFGFRQIESV